MLTILRFIYYDCREIPDNQVFDVFVASRQLGIESLFKVAERLVSLKIVPANFAVVY
jgi:hypothetical protein